MELNEGIIDTSSIPLNEWDSATEYILSPQQADEFVLAIDSDHYDSAEESPEPFYSPEWEQSFSEFKTEVEEVPSTPPSQVVLPVQPECSYLAQNETPELNLVLYQKRRGTGGLWQPVVQGERIRVDKSKGKLVRLYVKSKANIGEEGWTFQIYLVDKARPEMPIQAGDGFTIEPSRPAKGAVDPTGKEFKLKLTKISKNQYFLVTAKCGNVQLTGCTLEFRSDDNGKVLNSKKRPRSALEAPAGVSTNNGLLVCRDICADNDLVTLIARSLVPVILDNFQTQLANGTLEDSIAKRIKLAFSPTVKLEV